MIIDSLLRFSVNQDADGDSTNTLDMGVKAPNLGMAQRQMHLVVNGKSGLISSHFQINQYSLNISRRYS